MNETEKKIKENIQGCGVPLQSVLVYITSLSLSLTHISCYSKDRERIQQEHIMYLDWALLHWCFSLLCLMGAPGLPGLGGQMGREVPGPIWVLNGLSPVCLPSWFHSHVTWPCSERSPWLHSPGSSHQVCFNLDAHRKHCTRCYRNLPDPRSWASPSVPRWWIKVFSTLIPPCLIFIHPFPKNTISVKRRNNLPNYVKCCSNHVSDRSKLYIIRQFCCAAWQLMLFVILERFDLM